MNEKKKLLLENAMKLFSEKGFHNTTIQEIADKSGVSKGGFYLHFHSKEDLTLNIYQYYYQVLMDKMKHVQQSTTDPKQSLIKQIEVLFDSMVKNKEFIIMQMRDNVSIGKDVDQFIKQTKQENFKWNSENLLAIYGEQIKPYIVDATTLLNGILHSYLQWLIIDQLTIDTNRLAHFISRRIDDCMQGLLNDPEAPLIKYEQISKQMNDSFRIEKDSIETRLTRMKSNIDQLSIDKKQQSDLHVAIDLLIDEAKKETPQPVIFEGMLHHFKPIPEMKQDCAEICKQLNIKLHE